MKRFLYFIAIVIIGHSCKTAQKANDLPFLDDKPAPTDTIRITHEITKIDTVTLPGQVIIKTVTADCPPSPTPTVITKEVKVDCPPPQQIVKTVTKYDSITILKEDMRRIQPLLNLISQKDAEINLKSAEIKKAERWKGIFKWLSLISWLIIILLTLGLYIAYKKYKKTY